jgi:hypothetical protein
MLYRGAIHHAADAAEAVDANLDSHAFLQEPAESVI